MEIKLTKSKFLQFFKISKLFYYFCILKNWKNYDFYSDKISCSMRC